MEWGLLFNAVLTGLAIPLALQGIRWLGAKLNNERAFQLMRADDMLFAAVEKSVSNLAEGLAKQMRESGGGVLTREQKKYLEATAIMEAKILLRDRAPELAAQLTQDVGAILVRYVVDRLKTRPRVQLPTVQ